MKLYLLVVPLVVLLLPVKVGATGILSLKNISSNNSDGGECLIRNEKYWKIIKDFYGSISLVSLYFIHPFKPNASTLALSSTLLQEIPKSMFYLHIFFSTSHFLSKFAMTDKW